MGIKVSERAKEIVEQCKVLDSSGESKKAIDLLSRALQSDPEPVLYFERGMRFYDIGDFEQAVLDLSSAIEVEATAKLLVLRGSLYTNCLANPQLGWDDLQAALELAPDNALVHSNLCLFHRRYGSIFDAITHGIEATSISPSDPSVHQQLGMCYLESKRFDYALKEFEEATLLDPSYAQAWTGLSSAHENLGNIETASDCIQRSIDIEENARDFITLASLQIKLGSNERAIAALRQAQRFDLNEAQTLLVKGCYLRIEGAK